MTKKIGLIGFGCVAQGFYEGLMQNPKLGVEIKTIVVKDAKKIRTAPQALFTSALDDLLKDEEIDIFIELIDDPDIALLIARNALQRGIPLISANKKMIADHLIELVALQKKYTTPMLYEGAVAGSIPILQNLAQFFSHQKISSVRGILNGSTNYILTKMKNESLSFAQALREAQELGFAETDPSLDLTGTDAGYKSTILAYHVFGQCALPENIKISGIDNLSLNHLLQSRRTDKKLKLISDLSIHEGIVYINIKPTIISSHDSLFAVDEEYNALEIFGNLSGKQTFIGKGAGSQPTGAAVLNDLYLLLNQFQYSYLKVAELG
ncbi:homoserine dehydrogenase [Cyclobacteriaceae bacterium]|jgi:homoserine dehydrogenase|nr:homoserine dehydrogenase [Cyclobacteriaceae bacterium]|tara:strand:- start:1683 stop:2651 length:969 start_codon:yes stop_codon:yes gene_type:complete